MCFMIHFVYLYEENPSVAVKENYTVKPCHLSSGSKKPSRDIIPITPSHGEIFSLSKEALTTSVCFVGIAKLLVFILCHYSRKCLDLGEPTESNYYTTCPKLTNDTGTRRSEDCITDNNKVTLTREIESFN